jgi:hypothetical protein
MFVYVHPLLNFEQYFSYISVIYTDNQRIITVGMSLDMLKEKQKIMFAKATFFLIFFFSVLILHAGHQQKDTYSADDQAVNDELTLAEQISGCTADDALRADLCCPLNRLPSDTFRTPEEPAKTDSLSMTANSGVTHPTLASWIKYLLRWINLLIEVS